MALREVHGMVDGVASAAELFHRPAGLGGGVRDGGVELVGGDAATARRLHQHAAGANQLDALRGEQRVRLQRTVNAGLAWRERRRVNDDDIEMLRVQRS